MSCSSLCPCCVPWPNNLQFPQASVSYETAQRCENSPMVLRVSRLMCVSRSLCPARSVGAPASLPRVLWIYPPSPKVCILLRTSLSTICSNARFSAATIYLSVVGNQPHSPVSFLQRPSHDDIHRPPSRGFAEPPLRPRRSLPRPPCLSLPLPARLLSIAPPLLAPITAS